MKSIGTMAIIAALAFTVVVLSALAPAKADPNASGAANVEREDNPSSAGAAQPSTQNADGGQAAGQGGFFGNPSQLMLYGLLIGGVILMFVMSSRSRRKQEAKRRDMIESLKKGDKIVTIGGVIGTVVETRDDEVLIKVDDETRIKFARWAIRGVGEEARQENPQQQKK